MRSYLTALVGLLGLWTSLLTQETPKESKLRVDVSIAARDYALREIIPVHVRFTNTATSEVHLDLSSLGPQMISVEDPEGNPLELTFLRVKPSVPMDLRALAPGEYHETTEYISLALSVDSGKPRFRELKEGTWRFRVSYSLSAKEVVHSSLIPIRITSLPTKPSDPILLSLPWAQFVMGGGVTEEDFGRFKDLVMSTMPLSQRDLMAYQLALRTFNRGDYEACEALLKRALEDSAGNVKRITLTMTLAQCYFGAKKFDEAEGLVNQLVIESNNTARSAVQKFKEKLANKMNRR